MKKKLKLMLVTVIAMVMMSTLPVFGANDITVYGPNGGKISFDAPIYIENGLTMVPMSSIVNVMGAIATWNNETKTAYIMNTKITEYADVKVEMTFKLGDSVGHYLETATRKLYHNQTYGYFNEDRPIGTTIKIVNGRIMLPLRFLAENVGFDVQWDNETRSVSINKPGPVSYNPTSPIKPKFLYYPQTGEIEYLNSTVNKEGDQTVFQ